MGGTFGIKETGFDKSMKIGETLFEQIRNYDAQYVLTDCPTCKIQIEQGTGIKVIHPVSIIKKAYEHFLN